MIDQMEELTVRDRAIAAFILWRVWSHLLKASEWDAMALVEPLRDSLVNGGENPMPCDVWEAVCDCYSYTNKQGRWSEHRTWEETND